MTDKRVSRGDLTSFVQLTLPATTVPLLTPVILSWSSTVSPYKPGVALNPSVTAKGTSTTQLLSKAQYILGILIAEDPTIAHALLLPEDFPVESATAAFFDTFIGPDHILFTAEIISSAAPMEAEAVPDRGSQRRFSICIGFGSYLPSLNMKLVLRLGQYLHLDVFCLDSVCLCK